MLMLDALFRVDFRHPGAHEARENGLRFVPRRWRQFFDSIRGFSTPLRPWVMERRCPALTDAYQCCIELFTTYRMLHRHLAAQILRGATTTGRAFETRDDNYRTFVSEIGSLVRDTAALRIPGIGR
ncbi:hypothetical protein ACN27G_28665 [Plantactinospora sp. WMMB334]|uniref:hypothetical protein n=1 Tax=Plantactinospora sp. WMMB334 TaxID=3404119 RepID=UPI003B934F57